jgi:hypothetical protein
VAHGAEDGSKPSKSCSKKKKRASAEEELALGANMLVTGANMLVTTASILWIRSMMPVPAPKTGGAGGGSANVRSVRFVQNGRVEFSEPYSYCGDDAEGNHLECPEVVPGLHDIMLTVMPFTDGEHVSIALPHSFVTLVSNPFFTAIYQYLIRGCPYRYKKSSQTLES